MFAGQSLVRAGALGLGVRWLSCWPPCPQWPGMTTLGVSWMGIGTQMYLVDSNVISDAREGERVDPGVRTFFTEASHQDWPLFLSAISIAELRRGVDLIRHRGDLAQTEALEHWLQQQLHDYSDRVLVFN